MSKRINRTTPPTVRQKISDALKQYYSNGMSPEHKAKISAGLTKYWSTIPSVSDTENNNQEKENQQENGK